MEYARNQKELKNNQQEAKKEDALEYARSKKELKKEYARLQLEIIAVLTHKKAKAPNGFNFFVAFENDKRPCCWVKRSEVPIAVLFFEVINFRYIND